MLSLVEIRKVQEIQKTQQTPKKPPGLSPIQWVFPTAAVLCYLATALVGGASLPYMFLFFASAFLYLVFPGFALARRLGPGLEPSYQSGREVMTWGCI